LVWPVVLARAAALARANGLPPAVSRLTAATTDLERLVPAVAAEDLEQLHRSCLTTIPLSEQAERKVEPRTKS
jgi:hypothetical protein